MPALTNLEKVRLMFGDTDSTDYVLTDDQVNSFITSRTVLDGSGGTVNVNLAAAAADCAGAAAAEFARQFDFAEDSQRFDRSQKHSQYLALERELRNRSGGIAVPIAGSDTT